MISFAAERALPGFMLSATFTGRDGITALFGSSGAGKSTILAMVAGLITPDRGRIAIGDDVLFDSGAGVDVPPHRRRIGLVTQDAQLFPHLSVRQNLLFGRRFAKDRPPPIAFEALAGVLGLAHLLDRRPAGLSGGERQRVAIGRAILSAPQALLMDEPLAALDLARREEILPLVEQLRDELKLPILYVSHQIEEVARLAGHVVVLDGGQVVGEGPPTEVLGRQGAASGDASIIEAAIAGFDPVYALTEIAHPAGHLFVAGRQGEPGQLARVLIRASDVAIATERPAHLSIRNVLAGRVISIAAGTEAGALIDIELQGGGRLRASITRRAADELGLSPGLGVYALVKTAALDRRQNETPGDGSPGV